MAAGDPTVSPVFDYTSLDFNSLNDDLTRFAQSVFRESWTDFNVNQMGAKLIRLMAYGGDLLAYNINMWVLETLVATLLREQNLRDIGKYLDFTLHSASPSTTVLSYECDPAFFPLTISTHSKVVSAGQIVFQPDVTAVFNGPGTTYTVSATQGDEVIDEILGVSDGSPGQRFTLGFSPVIDGTLSVRVDATGYTVVANAVAAGPTDAVYRSETSEAGVTSIIFGDAINGRIPGFAAVVYGSYKTGGGSETDLPIDAITNQLTSIPGVVSVTNTKAATGGGPKQTVSDAKMALPAAIKANDRCVSAEDYAAMTQKLVPGVLKAAGVSSGTFAPGGPPMLLFVVPNGGGNPTPSLANQIVVALRPKKMGGKRVRVVNPLYVVFAVDLSIYVSAATPAQPTERRVRDILLLEYALVSPSVDFGRTYSLQEGGYAQVDPKLVDVTRVFYNTFTILPYAGSHVSNPSTGSGTIEAITVTDVVKRREWLVRFNAGTYTVIQRILGVASQVTDQVVVDDNADYVPNSLAGLSLHIREQDQSTLLTITANTSQAITTSGGLLTLAQPDDSYAVEHTEGVVGKVLRNLLVATTAAGLFDLHLNVAGGTWSVGDKVLVRQGLMAWTATITVVVLGSPGTLTLGTPAPFTFTAGATVDFLWSSDDGSVSFTVVQGSSPFVSGDERFVDTYAKVGDIVLRPEAILSGLAEANLTTRVIGGVK